MEEIENQIIGLLQAKSTYLKNQVKGLDLARLNDDRSTSLKLIVEFSEYISEFTEKYNALLFLKEGIDVVK